MSVRRLLRDKVRHWLLARQGVELSEMTMPAKRYKVTLEPDERRDLEKLISRGKGAARRLAHARILLHADRGEGGPGKIDEEIAEAVPSVPMMMGHLSPGRLPSKAQENHQVVMPSKVVDVAAAAKAAASPELSDRPRRRT